MAKINRYPGNLKAFASDALGTERTIFGDTAQADDLASNITADFLRGWGIVGVNENPTKQDFNGLAFTLGQLVSYIHQAGVPEWDDEQEYHEHSMTNRNGDIYICKTNSHVSVTPPESDTTNWFKWLSQSDIGTADGDLVLKENIPSVLAGGNLRNIEIFTASGTYTKPSWLKFAVVEGVAGGGGGGGVAGGTGRAAGDGGAAGGPMRFKIAAADLGATETVTVGTGGAGGAAGNNKGAAGGTTSFGAHGTATGGSGGNGKANTTGTSNGSFAAGGSVSYGASAEYLIPGSSEGGYGFNGLVSDSLISVPGAGGMSLYGSGATPNVFGSASGAGVPAQSKGSGGSGANTGTATDRAGGAGADGIVIVYEYE